MSPWFPSLFFAILVTIIPFSFVLKLLHQFPEPLARSHRRWPMMANYTLIAAITACVAYFVHAAAYGSAPASVVAGFLIAAAAYAFGLVLLLRQFCGVYAEFIVTSSAGGLQVQKTRYRNIEDVDRAGGTAGEARLRVRTSRQSTVVMTLKAKDVGVFYEQLRKKQSDG